MLAAAPDVIIMISAYSSCSEFIKQAKAKGLLARFVNVKLWQVRVRWRRRSGLRTRWRHDFAGDAAADSYKIRCGVGLSKGSARGWCE